MYFRLPEVYDVSIFILLSIIYYWSLGSLFRCWKRLMFSSYYVLNGISLSGLHVYFFAGSVWRFYAYYNYYIVILTIIIIIIKYNYHYLNDISWLVRSVNVHNISNIILCFFSQEYTPVRSVRRFCYVCVVTVCVRWSYNIKSRYLNTCSLGQVTAIIWKWLTFHLSLSCCLHRVVYLWMHGRMTS